MIVLGANVQVLLIDPDLYWWLLIFEGKMNYHMHYVFRAQQEPGATIPYLYYESIVGTEAMCGTGVGKFTEVASAYGFRSGKTGVVKINQVFDEGIYFEEIISFMQYK